MPLLTPEGDPFYGNAIDPETYCMTADQVGQLLAAAMSKITGDFIMVLTIYMVIALLMGFGMGLLVMWVHCNMEKKRIEE